MLATHFFVGLAEQLAQKAAGVRCQLYEEKGDVQVLHRTATQPHVALVFFGVYASPKAGREWTALSSGGAWGSALLAAHCALEVWLQHARCRGAALSLHHALSSSWTQCAQAAEVQGWATWKAPAVAVAPAKQAT